MMVPLSCSGKNTFFLLKQNMIKTIRGACCRSDIFVWRDKVNVPWCAILHCRGGFLFLSLPFSLSLRPPRSRAPLPPLLLSAYLLVSLSVSVLRCAISRAADACVFFFSSATFPSRRLKIHSCLFYCQALLLFIFKNIFFLFSVYALFFFFSVSFSFVCTVVRKGV